MSLKISPSYFVVIPAAGKGTRFGSQGNAVKQHEDLLGKSVLQRSIEPFLEHKKINGVVVVLSDGDTGAENLTESLDQSKLTIVSLGGKTRAETVLNGIRSLGGEVRDVDWILVHDAARPLITAELIDRLIDGVGNYSDGGLLACRLVDTIKQSDDRDHIFSTVDRKKFWSAQTPQMFRRATLEEALEGKNNFEEITDESSAVERLGMKPRLIQSEADNFKITYERDLDRAQLVLEQRSFRKVADK
ncbi:MAG: 2-C-methyl-D-erythritol 4-phosphate cytidylyltransferase [Burkholderiales bacterium]